MLECVNGQCFACFSRAWRFGLWLVVPVLAWLAGCGGASSAPGTVPVEGKITYQGEPVSKGTITFEPVEVAEGFPSRPASGNIQSDGTYAMSTFEHRDGVVPGTYKVRIVSMESTPTFEDPDLPEVWNIPEKYGKTETSGLTVNVPVDASGTIEQDFELEE